MSEAMMITPFWMWIYLALWVAFCLWITGVVVASLTVKPKPEDYDMKASEMLKGFGVSQATFWSDEKETFTTFPCVRVSDVEFLLDLLIRHSDTSDQIIKEMYEAIDKHVGEGARDANKPCPECNDTGAKQEPGTRPQDGAMVPCRHKPMPTPADQAPYPTDEDCPRCEKGVLWFHPETLQKICSKCRASWMLQCSPGDPVPQPMIAKSGPPAAPERICEDEAVKVLSRALDLAYHSSTPEKHNFDGAATELRRVIRAKVERLERELEVEHGVSAHVDPAFKAGKEAERARIQTKIQEHHDTHSQADQNTYRAGIVSGLYEALFIIKKMGDEE